MFRAGLAVIALMAVVSGITPGKACAQAPVVPSPPYHAMRPNALLAPQAAGPVQQQILENYRAQLLQAQRELLQQNPSGLGRDQLEISRQLNAYNPALNPASPAASGAAPPPSFDVTPFAPTAAVPAPPFNAAPRP